MRSSSRRSCLLGRPSPLDHLDAGRNLADDRRWAVVDVARGGDRRADARLDRPHDLDDPLAFGDQRVHHVARTNLRRWLCLVAVDAHVAALAQLGRHGPRLDEAHSAQPAIDPGVVGHGHSVACGLRAIPQDIRIRGSAAASRRSSSGCRPRPALRPPTSVRHRAAIAHRFARRVTATDGRSCHPAIRRAPWGP